MERVVDLNRWQKEHIKSECDVRQLFNEVSANYRSEPYSSYKARIEQLKLLKRALLNKRQELVDSLSRDYGFRYSFDSLVCDILPAVSHINYTIKHLKRWMKSSKRSPGLLLLPSSVKVEYQPLGVIGVMVPWNFPIVLSIAPVVTAIAAGNRVIVKLSEYTHDTNQVLSQIFNELEPSIYSVEGDKDIASYFSQLPFDHLFFTGSTSVGRLVAQAAAKNLTPVTLELGGKSPTIVDDEVDLIRAVDAVMLGKSVNAGQICVAPDYVFVPKGKELKFVRLYLERFRSLYIENKGERSITQIINDAQYQRLIQFLDDAKAHGASIHTLEDVDVSGRRILPHLITGINEKMRVMHQEIFGPILPVIGYRHLNDVFTYINNRPKPLAIYLMSDDKVLQRQVIEQIPCGSLAINDTLVQVAVDDAPFGGVGESGCGVYHGIEGFRAFSNAKTVLTTPSWLPRSRLLLKYRKLAQSVISILFIC